MIGRARDWSSSPSRRSRTWSATTEVASGKLCPADRLPAKMRNQVGYDTAIRDVGEDGGAAVLGRWKDLPDRGESTGASISPPNDRMEHPAR
jgi:hypothetical protein